MVAAGVKHVNAGVVDVVVAEAVLGGFVPAHGHSEALAGPEDRARWPDLDVDGHDLAGLEQKPAGVGVYWALRGRQRLVELAV